MFTLNRLKLKICAYEMLTNTQSCCSGTIMQTHLWNVALRHTKYSIRRMMAQRIDQVMNWNGRPLHSINMFHFYRIVMGLRMRTLLRWKVCLSLIVDITHTIRMLTGMLVCNFLLQDFIKFERLIYSDAMEISRTHMNTNLALDTMHEHKQLIEFQVEICKLERSNIMPQCDRH